MKGLIRDLIRKWIDLLINERINKRFNKKMNIFKCPEADHKHCYPPKKKADNSESEKD